MNYIKRLTIAAGLTVVTGICVAADVQPAQVVGSLEGTFGVHPGLRRNHTKGLCATGDFVGSRTAADLSRSALFSGEHIPVLGRF